jgi:hypothetical protein
MGDLEKMKEEAELCVSKTRTHADKMMGYHALYAPHLVGEVCARIFVSFACVFVKV